MYLRSLYLHHFRVYEEAFIQFQPEVNVIHGPNAFGKTSLLEAIYFLMTGRSFRTSQATDMIRYGASAFYLEATFIKHDIEQKLRLSCSSKERKIFYNHTQCTSSSDLLGLLHGAIIHPDDAAVIKGAPELRRHLLDLQIAQANPLYVHYLTRYNRAMRQRNHLLRNKNIATIESWEYEMANAASYIVLQRIQAVEDLQRQGRVIHHLICNLDHLDLSYKATGLQRGLNASQTDPNHLRTMYLEQYHKMRQREMDLGVTLVGPHKDDLLISLGGHEARYFASEGQQRTCMAALRLAEWHRLKATTQEIPLMLIDDMGMSLDQSRRIRLSKHFSTLGQVFLTTTEKISFDGNPYYVNVESYQKI